MPNFVGPCSYKGLFERQPIPNEIAQNLRLRMLKLKLRSMPRQVVFGLRRCVEYLRPEFKKLIDSLVNYGLPSFIRYLSVGHFELMLLTIALDVFVDMPAAQQMRHFGPYNAAGIMKSTGLISRN